MIASSSLGINVLWSSNNDKTSSQLQKFFTVFIQIKWQKFFTYLHCKDISICVIKWKCGCKHSTKVGPMYRKFQWNFVEIYLKRLLIFTLRTSAILLSDSLSFWSMSWGNKTPEYRFKNSDRSVASHKWKGKSANSFFDEIHFPKRKSNWYSINDLTDGYFNVFATCSMMYITSCLSSVWFQKIQWHFNEISYQSEQLSHRIETWSASR